RETGAFRADKMLARDLDIVEQQFAQRAAVHAHLGNRADREPRHLALEQQAGHLAAARLAGPDEHHAELAYGPQADVELAAADLPALPGGHRPRFDVGGVRADVGFAQGEAGDRLAAEYARQVLLLQFRRTAICQHGSRQVAGADDAAQRRP